MHKSLLIHPTLQSIMRSIWFRIAANSSGRDESRQRKSDTGGHRDTDHVAGDILMYKENRGQDQPTLLVQNGNGLFISREYGRTIWVCTQVLGICRHIPVLNQTTRLPTLKLLLCIPNIVKILCLPSWGKLGKAPATPSLAQTTFTTGPISSNVLDLFTLTDRTQAHSLACQCLGPSHGVSGDGYLFQRSYTDRAPKRS